MNHAFPLSQWIDSDNLIWWVENVEKKHMLLEFGISATEIENPHHKKRIILTKTPRVKDYLHPIDNIVDVDSLLQFYFNTFLLSDLYSIIC